MHKDGRTDGRTSSELEASGTKKITEMSLASLACQPAPGDRGLCLQKSTNKRSARTAIPHTLPEGVERRTPSRNGLTLESKTCISVCFFIPFIVFALLFSLPPSRNSDPGSHSILFSPPPHYGSCLAFLSREDFSFFFPRRLASHAKKG